MLDSNDLKAIADLLDTKIDSKLKPIKDKLDTLDLKITGVNLHLENVTDKNIQTLAENHLSFIDKLNETVKVANKDLIYEIQVRILNGKVEKMEKEIAELKTKIA